MPFVETPEQAIDAYVRWHQRRGLMFDQPAGGPEWDEERGGWVLENIRGVLAVIAEDGTFVDFDDDERDD